MSALLELTDFLNSDGMLLSLMVACIGAYLAGQIIDAVMGKRGFGVLGNSFLVLLGVGVGLVGAHHQVGVLQLSDTARLMLFTGASSTVILLVCGIIKGWVSPNY
jgi:hypothetical protein